MSQDTISKKPEHAQQQENERRKFRFAFAIFLVYAISYTFFTLAGTFYKGVLSARVGGLNLGVVSGMIIIISAIGIAVVYNWYAGRLEV